MPPVGVKHQSKQHNNKGRTMRNHRPAPPPGRPAAPPPAPAAPKGRAAPPPGARQGGNPWDAYKNVAGKQGISGSNSLRFTPGTYIVKLEKTVFKESERDPSIRVVVCDMSIVEVENEFQGSRKAGDLVTAFAAKSGGAYPERFQKCMNQAAALAHGIGHETSDIDAALGEIYPDSDNPWADALDAAFGGDFTFGAGFLFRVVCSPTKGKDGKDYTNEHYSALEPEEYAAFGMAHPWAE
jgi:hypothetical protein